MRACFSGSFWELMERGQKMKREEERGLLSSVLFVPLFNRSSLQARGRAVLDT